MITRLCVKGFRALKDFALEVPPGVPVVLIGSNGTGKTTILVLVATHSDRLLDFLSDPASSIHVVEHDVDAGVIARRLDPDSLAAWLSQYRASELPQMGLLDAPREDDHDEVLARAWAGRPRRVAERSTPPMSPRDRFTPLP